MKLGKQLKTSAFLIYFILAALLNLIIFAIFKPGNIEGNNLRVVFWFSYGFMMMAFVLQIVSTLTGRQQDGFEAIFFGIPLFKISIFYFVIATVLSLAFMILTYCSVEVPFILMFILECIVLGGFLIAYIFAMTHKNVVVEIDQTIKQNVFSIRTLVSDVEVLAESVEDANLKAKLNRLAEDIKYSDPMSNDVVKELDLQMKDAIAELEVYVADGDAANIESKIKQAQLIVSKRNKRLADSK